MAAQLIARNRLDQVVEGAALHRLDGRLRRPVGGDEDHRALGVEGVDVAEDVEAGAVGQLQVEDDHVGPVLGQAGQPLGRGARRQHLCPLGLEDAAEGVEDGRLIVDDQKRRHGSPRRSPAALRKPVERW
jgi:hypothetical protein